MTAFPKFPYIRSPSYRRWVAELRCIVCKVEGYSQCAHSNQKKHGKGRSIKASDEFTFPLCGPHGGHLGCHAWHDLTLGGPNGESRSELENRYIAETWKSAQAAGWTVVGRRLMQQNKVVS